MLTSSISNTKWCHSVGESCNFMNSYIIGFVLEDVVAHVLGQLCCIFGRCYCQVALFVVDVIPPGRCCNLFYIVVVMLPQG